MARHRPRTRRSIPEESLRPNFRRAGDTLAQHSLLLLFIDADEKASHDDVDRHDDDDVCDDSIENDSVCDNGGCGFSRICTSRLCKLTPTSTSAASRGLRRLEVSETLADPGGVPETSIKP